MMSVARAGIAFVLAGLHVNAFRYNRAARVSSFEVDDETAGVKGQLSDADPAAKKKPTVPGRAAVQGAPASKQRAECIAREDGDTRVFSPESMGDNYTWKGDFGGTPLGAVHVAIEDLQLTLFRASIRLARKSDDTFSFSLGGQDGEAAARAQLWIEGLHLEMPQSSIDEIASGISKLENNVVWLFTGWQNYGQIKNLKADVGLSMSGELKLDRVTNGWSVAPDTARHSLDLQVGSKGALMYIINKIIKKAGGIDKIFFDLLWPFIAKVLPPFFGQAVSVVPKEAGMVETVIDLVATCRSPAASGSKQDGRRCPAHLIDIRADLKNHVLFESGPVLADMVDDLPGLEKAIAAYERGSPVLRGLNVVAGAEVCLKGQASQRRLEFDVKPDFRLPFPFLEAYMNKVNLDDFIPGGRKFEFQGGRLEAKDGKIRIPAASIEGMRLPVHTDALEISGSWRDFELEADPDDDEDEDPLTALDKYFGKDSALTVEAPGVVFTMAHGTGATLTPRAGVSALRATYAQKGLAEVFAGISNTLATGGNKRTGPFDAADGAVPPEFQRPHARPPKSVDFLASLGDVTASTHFGAVSRSRTAAKEFLNFTVTVGLSAAVLLDKHFIKGFTESGDKDLGYFHYVVAGVYGQFGVMWSLPTRKALIRLSCGNLEMYKLDNSRGATDSAKPFRTEAWLTLDLAKDADWDVLQQGEPTISRKQRCFRLKSTARYFSSGTRDKFFCVPDPAGQELQRALSLQRQRIEAAQVRAEADGEAQPVQPWWPDGTWFRQPDPYDSASQEPKFRDVALVSSPQEQWLRAVS